MGWIDVPENSELQEGTPEGWKDVPEGYSLEPAQPTSLWQDIKSFFYTPNVSPAKAANIVGLSEQEGITPTQAMRDYDPLVDKTFEARDVTGKKVAHGAMTAGVMVGLATHPIATAIGVASFMGLDEVENYLVSKALDDPNSKSNLGLSDLFQAEGLSKDALDLGDFIIKGAVTGGVTKFTKKPVEGMFEYFGNVIRGITDKGEKVKVINDTARIMQEQDLTPDQAVRVAVAEKGKAEITPEAVAFDDPTKTIEPGKALTEEIPGKVIGGGRGTAGSYRGGGKTSGNE